VPLPREDIIGALVVRCLWGAHFRSASRGASLVLVDQHAEADAQSDDF